MKVLDLLDLLSDDDGVLLADLGLRVGFVVEVAVVLVGVTVEAAEQLATAAVESG